MKKNLFLFFVVSVMFIGCSAAARNNLSLQKEIVIGGRKTQIFLKETKVEGFNSPTYYSPYFRIEVGTGDTMFSGQGNYEFSPAELSRFEFLEDGTVVFKRKGVFSLWKNGWEYEFYVDEKIPE